MHAKKKSSMLFAVLPAISLLLAGTGSAFAVTVGGCETIVAGNKYSLAIDDDGSLWAWGNNEYGQLGVGSSDWESRKLAPVKIMDGVATVSGRESHSLAVKTDGSLWTWGDNTSGQLGDGTAFSSYAPVKIMDGVVAVSAGGAHSLAIKADGSLWAWGNNSSGQLGDGTSGVANSKLTPVKIMDGAAAVSAGYLHNLAIKTDGSLWAWGNNEYGQIGDGSGSGSQNNKSAPVQIMAGAVSIAAGYGHSLAATEKGYFYVWGNADFGQLHLIRLNETEPAFNQGPVIAAANGYVAYNLIKPQLNTTVGYIADISAGYDHTLAALKNGNLQVWGWNMHGQVGNGKTNEKIHEGFSRMSDSAKIMDDVKLPDGAQLDIRVYLNGERLSFDVPPIIENGRTLVPLRAIFEALGAEVDWDQSTKTITATKGEITITMQIDNPVMTKNGVPTTLDAPPKIIDNRTLVPVRAVAESFDATVDWHNDKKYVIIKKEEMDEE
ncbi:MAG: stalk domain-containing protein [Clostridiales bacterium]|nr:stalk domain-containing protein [Clostridiales bacterium]